MDVHGTLNFNSLHIGAAKPVSSSVSTNQHPLPAGHRLVHAAYICPTSREAVSSRRLRADCHRSAKEGPLCDPQQSTGLANKALLGHFRSPLGALCLLAKLEPERLIQMARRVETLERSKVRFAEMLVDETHCVRHELSSYSETAQPVVHDKPTQMRDSRFKVAVDGK